MSGLGQFEEVLSQGRLAVNPERCLRLRHRQSSCRLCLENCPTVLADPRSFGLPHPFLKGYSNTLFEIQGQWD